LAKKEKGKEKYNNNCKKEKEIALLCKKDRNFK
jgi:hypothetical protein